MVRHQYLSVLLLAGLGWLLAFTAQAAQPLRVLYLTSPGIYHNYHYQAAAIPAALAARANVAVDVSLHELERWKTTDFAQGYDALIYNICIADNADQQLIANLRRQSETLGVPALFIHCTMHSFRTTNAWWPVVGLKTRAHEQQHPLEQRHAGSHPLLTGIPPDWVVAEDELYINRDFQGTALLLSPGEDGADHVTSWLHQVGTTPVFGTTLGHNDATIDDPVFQQLLANALLYVTGKLGADGNPLPGYGAQNMSGPAVRNFSAAAGVYYLNQDCSYKLMVRAIGPCYLGCIINPLLWGEEADTCKEACSAQQPSQAEYLQACALPRAEQKEEPAL